MPLELDKIDEAILKVLMEDGRKSFRQIAEEVRVSAPTVESHFRRMANTGLIKKIAPIFNLEKVEQGVAALVLIRADPVKLSYVADELARLYEARSVFTITGESNLVIRVMVNDPGALEGLVAKKVATIQGVLSASSQLITRTVKDEQGVSIRAGLMVRLECDFCRGEVKGAPRVLKVGNSERYFCCTSCLMLYKEKYHHRLKKLGAL